MGREADMRSEAGVSSPPALSGEAGQALEAAAAALDAVTAAMAEADARVLAAVVADICRTTAHTLAAAGAWPELALVQVRAAYEATRIAAGECAQDDAAGACVAPLSDARDVAKRLLGALESDAATTPPVAERDLPRVDADDDAVW